MSYDGLLKMAAEFEDRAVRKEIHDLLGVIKKQTPAMTGDILVMLRNYLRKIVEY